MSWEIIGMKAAFSTEFVEEDKIAAQHVDILGSMPSERWQKEGRARFFETLGVGPTRTREMIAYP